MQLQQHGILGNQSIESIPQEYWGSYMPLEEGANYCGSRILYESNGAVIDIASQSHAISGSPFDLIQDKDRCDNVVQELEKGDSHARLTILLWLHKATLQLALSKLGCRVVQKVLEVTGGSDKGGLIIAELKDRIVELYESPHGNHVLSRAIEVLPAAKIGFIIEALRGRGVAVSKHKFGCRVVCRLIEHCTEEQIGSLLDEILPETAALARNSYGNFVVQSILEHTGSQARRSFMMSLLLPGFASLAMHRSGSLVAQRVLDYCYLEEDRNLVFHALLSGEGECSIVEIACSHYGSFVIEQLAASYDKQLSAPKLSEIVAILATHVHRLVESQHGQRVALAFALATSEELELHSVTKETAMAF